MFVNTVLSIAYCFIAHLFCKKATDVRLLYFMVANLNVHRLGDLKMTKSFIVVPLVVCINIKAGMADPLSTQENT